MGLDDYTHEELLNIVDKYERRKQYEKNYKKIHKVSDRSEANKKYYEKAKQSPDWQDRYKKYSQNQKDNRKHYGRFSYYKTRNRLDDLLKKFPDTYKKYQHLI